MQVVVLTDYNAKTVLYHTVPMHTSTALLRLMHTLSKRKDQSKGAKERC